MKHKTTSAENHKLCMEQAYLLVLLVMQNISEWALTAECLMFFYDELCRKLQHHNYAKVLEFMYTSVCESFNEQETKILPFSFCSGPTFCEE